MYKRIFDVYVFCIRFLSQFSIIDKYTIREGIFNDLKNDGVPFVRNENISTEENYNIFKKNLIDKIIELFENKYLSDEMKNKYEALSKQELTEILSKGDNQE